MDDYISRKALIEHIKAHCGGCDNCGEVMHCAWDTQAADVEPVRHAEWEWFDELNGNPLEGQDRDCGWRCSGCKTELPDDYDDPDCKPNIKYCSECGAKMDGGEP